MDRANPAYVKIKERIFFFLCIKLAGTLYNNVAVRITYFSQFQPQINAVDRSKSFGIIIAFRTQTNQRHQRKVFLFTKQKEKKNKQLKKIYNYRVKQICSSNYKNLFIYSW